MEKTLLFILLASVVFAGCMGGPSVGSDRDEHGCIGSAGYIWCEAKQKCLRTFEERCDAEATTTTLRQDTETTLPRGPLVGNDVDAHGCKPSAGYTWCEAKQKCLRAWEENCTAPLEREYVSRDLSVCARIDYGCGRGAGFTDETGCGCMVPAADTQGVKACTKEAKVCPDGSSVGRDANNNCEFAPCPGSNAGGGGSEAKNYCTATQRGARMCTMEYMPVCGWYDPARIQCIKYPCAQTYGNKCGACADDKVAYWTAGECPKTAGTKPAGGNTQIANPASVYCTNDMNGSWSVKDTPEGQTGYCTLPGGKVCEEWALLRSNGTECKG